MKSKIPYGRQNIDYKDIDAVVTALKSDYLTQGPIVREFEEKFAKLHKTYLDQIEKSKKIDEEISTYLDQIDAIKN